METFAVAVGPSKFWCTGTDEGGQVYLALDKPSPECPMLTFPNRDTAWSWATRKMEDPNGNKFRIVQIVADVASEDEPDTVTAESEPPRSAPEPKRKAKRRKRNGK